MPTTTTERPRLQAANGSSTRLELTPVRRQRQRPWIVGGAVLVVVGALGMSEIVSHIGGRLSVLVLTHNLAAGQVLQPSDLRSVDVANDSGVAFVPATSEDSVVGHPVSVPIVAGAPLVQTDIGAAMVTTAGKAVVAVLVKSGQAPPAIASGDRVEVVETVTSTGTGSAPGGTAIAAPLSTVTAIVVAVDQPAATAVSGTIVSLQLAASDAIAVAQAAAGGGISLVLLSPGT